MPASTEREQEECILCLFDFAETAHMPVIELPVCKHVFHRACAQQLMDARDRCPCCRAEVDWSFLRHPANVRLLRRLKRLEQKMELHGATSMPFTETLRRKHQWYSFPPETARGKGPSKSENSSLALRELVVSNQLAYLVPTFDPAVDSVEIWSSKVELLLHTWPSNKISELATRLILGCKGTAYQKLQLHRSECLVNEAKGIRRIVELVGGTWGQVPLEKKFQLVEQALFRSSQKADETGDSYLSRCDVIWTELLAKGTTLAEVRSYIVLRGSRLGPEDKKRVIVESGAEDGSGELNLKRVTSAIRMLASNFFQDFTGMKREKSLKTYDHTAFTLEETMENEGSENAFWTTAGPDDVLDDHILETLAGEDDEDAAMVMEFEDAIADSIQSNTDISAFFTSYQEARKRLSEKVKFRGFWGVRKGFDKSGKKGKMKGRGKGGSLASRIANSYFQTAEKDDQNKAEKLSQTPLTELARMKVAFGTAKKGLEFQEAFEDQKWTDWFISHYEKSTKYEHMAYVEYVKKQLDHMAANGGYPSTTPQPKAKMTAAKTLSKPKAAPASEHSWTQIKSEHGVESDTESCLEQFMEEPTQGTAIALLEDRMVQVYHDNQALNTRMTHMENAMQEILNHVRQLSVMCSPESELTNQMLSLGGSAMRFGKAEGDLNTTDGRGNLFQKLVRYRPRNVWFSPDCGPWCLWSNLNMNKSLKMFEKILEQRENNLWQISLGIVLLRFQQSNHSHFHSEQPNGSVLWHVPGAEELTRYTHKCQFDMCNVGQLKDPQTGEFIRKRLVVETTSDSLHRDLNNRKCDGSHNHRQIAGTTMVDGKHQSLSSFTALYPSRFARAVAKILKHDKQKPEWICTTDDHPTKRRRLLGKWGADEIAERFQDISWQEVIKTAQNIAPRVGTMVVEQGPLMEQVQKMCPNHCVQHLVLCKGIDRKVGPNKVTPKGMAPLRRMIGIHRSTGQLYIEDEWEPWERLTLKGLRRKGEPIRLGMTIFASVKHPDDQRNQMAPTESTPAATDVPIRVRESGQHPEQPLSKRLRMSTCPTDPTDPNEASIDREFVDLTSGKHGPLFQALTSEEQSWMLKLHRNLGHPGTQKLTEFCRQLGCPERILHAIPDIRCSTCAEAGRPKISRPSAIHETVDFGEIVSMDGITWSNAQGQSFNIYHMICQGTSYHTAVVTPSKSSEQAIQALLNGWLQWAGPPGTLIVDAATELNSEEFSFFLQRHNIRCRTIATDAHWQNSRIERHGGILQVMLNKMDKESAIDTPQKLQEALCQATGTKNQWSRHRGYPPEILVFGKSVRVPGSVVNEGFSAANTLAINPQTEGQIFREQLAVRERARKAFAEVDNDQTLRRALAHRSRPHRGVYIQGEWVMIWKKRGEADGNWHGPMQVISQEGSSVVWVSMGTKLYRVAPEHVRTLSAVEEWKHHPHDELIRNVPSASIVPRHGGTQFHDLTGPHPQNHTDTNADHIPPGNTQGIAVPETQENPEEVGSQDTQSQQPDLEPDVSTLPHTPPELSGDDAAGGNSGVESNQTGPMSQPVFQPSDPSEIPVPEAPSDDELFVDTTHDCFALQEDQCWCFEVEVNTHDIAKWKHSSHPQEMSFLVSAAKRQRSEVKLNTLTPEQRKLFVEAKDKEIGSWLSTNTVERILRHQVPHENIMRCRWILTWKPVDSETPIDKKKEPVKPKLIPKARLVVLGYEDPLVHEIPRDSPTMSKLSRMLILQQAASRQWEIESFDIKTAFLRGNEVSDRILGMEPPEELRTKMKLKPQEIVRLLKGAYGRVDAPYLWFMELKKGLEELGFIAAPFDPCAFVLPEPHSGRIEGLIGIHVDDGLCCGSPNFQKKLLKLKEKFPFGSHKKKNFTLTGLKIDQAEDFSMSVSQEQYVKDIQPIGLKGDRKGVPDAPVTEDERQALRALVGSLQYAAVNSRPDICSRLGWLQSRINSAKVDTLIEANKALHEAKAHAKVTIRVQPIEIDKVRFIAFSDASFASQKEPDSHQGMIIMACDEKIQNNKQSVVNPIVWHSKKIQKVAVSTLSAEAMALAGSVDVLSWIRLYWGWLMNTNLPWKLADETLFKLPPAFAAIPPTEGDQSCATPPTDLQKLLPTLPKSQSSLITTDCKSLYDMISRTAPPACQEFRTQLQAKLIKEHLRNGIVIRWVPSGAQMADALTKVMDGATLRECIALGRYCLKDESEILKARSDSRARVQWLRQNANIT
eukprot:symbB.v1.2.025839.t2/scaffold2536.1/size76742/5